MKVESTVRLGIGIYTVQDIATILHLPVRKVKRWLDDYWNGILKDIHKTSFTWGEGRNTAMSFYGLIEFYTFYLLRQEGLSVTKIIEAYKAISKFKQTGYPFASSKILTDSGSILFEFDETVAIDADPGYKTRITSLLKDYCRKIDFDSNSIAERFYPLGRDKKVIIDPHHQFGQPIIEGTNIYPDTIFHLYKAGEKISRITSLYDLNEKQVKDAIDYCEMGA